MSFRPLMKFVVKHSCQYNENITQKMYGKYRKKKSKKEKRRWEGRKEGGRGGGINKSYLSLALY